MERYNIFYLIHKGLRAGLFRTAMQLQQTDFCFPDEANAAIEKVKELVLLFEEHAHKEDHFILPVVEAYEPSVVTCFADEHKEDEALGLALINCVNCLQMAEQPAHKNISAQKLSEAFNRFLVFNLNHMAKEEDILNKILWRYCSDEEIKQIGRNIGASVQPWLQDFYATWMLRGTNHTEATNWIKSMEQAMPEVVFQTLMQKAATELDPSRFQRLQMELSPNKKEAIRA